jgi:hypothetical protein
MGQVTGAKPSFPHEPVARPTTARGKCIGSIQVAKSRFTPRYPRGHLVRLPIRGPAELGALRGNRGVRPEFISPAAVGENNYGLYEVPL